MSTTTSTLASHAADYMKLRRMLGFTLTRQGHELAGLVAFCDAADADTLTSELAITWAPLPQSVATIEWAHRLGTARAFARYLTALDPATEVPPLGVFPRTVHRRAPYLYSDGDIRRLLDAAADLRPSLRSASCVTVLGLLAATGMRVGEALGMTASALNRSTGVLTITEAKRQRSRIVPLHPTTSAALASYAALRRRLCPTSTAFFVSSVGTPLAYSTLRQTFNQLAAATGLRTPTRRVHMLSRPRARFWCYHQPVSPGRSPNPPYRFLGSGISNSG